MTPDSTSGAENPLKQATWIWFKEGNPAVSAPVGNRYFRRSFTLEGNAGIESARVFMSADNSFELWVNGRRAGAGDNFHVASVLDVKAMLRAGVNVLAVAAENGGATPNPAGLIGALVVKFRDGHALTVPTDKSWQSAQATQGKWTTDATAAGDWTAAMELGPLGMAPWGAVEKSAARAWGVLRLRRRNGAAGQAGRAAGLRVGRSAALHSPPNGRGGHLLRRQSGRAARGGKLHFPSIGQKRRSCGTR